jgi:ankyrin repeat protein
MDLIAEIRRRHHVDTDNKLLNESPFKAAAKGSLKKVKSLIAQGADINFQDEHGTSVLMQAVIHNNTKIVLLLLDLKVNVDLADKDAGDTEEASNRLKF